MVILKIYSQILSVYPESNFSQKGVFNIWHALDEKNWKRHDDPLRSAELLLEELHDDPMVRYKPEHISLSTSIEGFQSLAWALPPVIVKWGGRVRELALDSACKYIFPFIYLFLRFIQGRPMAPGLSSMGYLEKLGALDYLLASSFFEVRMVRLEVLRNTYQSS